MMWHGLKVEVLSLKHRPSHRYLDMRQECRTFETQGCDWLLLVLAMRARGASLTKTDGKIDEYGSKAFGMGQELSKIYCLVNKARNICESYLTKAYSTISKASSCRCIGIDGWLCYYRGSFTRFLGKTLVFW